MSARTARIAALITALAQVCAACGAREARTTTVRRLAVGLVRSAGLSSERSWSEADDSLELVPAAEPTGFWVRASIPGSRWTSVPSHRNVWTAPRPFLGSGPPGRKDALHRLISASREYELASWRGRPDGDVPAGYFSVLGTALYATTDEASGPGEATFLDFVELGHSDDISCRISIEGHAGDGFLLAPGFPCSIPLDLEEPSVLIFESCTIGRGGSLDLEVLLGERVVHRESMPSAPRSREASHRIELPALRSDQPLTLRVAGVPAVSAILAPIVVPNTGLSAPHAPDVVLFIADTFRADNLEAYGGEAYLTPNANRLAREGLVFTNAIAPSPWTLPSHASLFTGLYPPETAVQTPRDALSSEAATLAESLLAAGYRTAAVTDDGYVMPEYGLAQGFELFDARRRPPEETLAAVEGVLARDDGRPLFLVVHTYRAHHPYVVSSETRATLGERIGLRADLDEADYAALPQSLADWSPERVFTPEKRCQMSDYEALYRGASADLDRLLGDCLALLRAKDRADIVVFASDHGEAFWEHGVAEHGNGVWNEHLEIPLVFVAPGLAPGTRTALASLIDVPRTLAGLTGTAADPHWGGLDLLAPRGQRPLLAFQCDLHGNPSSFALFVDGKKLVFPDDPGETSLVPSAAFDLSRDPEERHDLSGEAWARQLAESSAREIQSSRGRKVNVSSATPGAAALEELGHLGYGNR